MGNDLDMGSIIILNFKFEIVPEYFDSIIHVSVVDYFYHVHVLNLENV